jgi:hypothetical protein
MKVLLPTRLGRLRVASCIFVVGASVGCRNDHEAPDSSATTAPANPAFLQFFSLSPTLAGSHVIQLKALDGTTWYREPVAGLDLSYIDFAKTQVTRSIKGPAIGLMVRESYREPFRSWTRERIGMQTGYLIDGNLRGIRPLAAPLTSGLLMTGFASVAEAEQMLARLKAGG